MSARLRSREQDGRRAPSTSPLPSSGVRKALRSGLSYSARHKQPPALTKGVKTAKHNPVSCQNADLVAAPRSQRQFGDNVAGDDPNAQGSQTGGHWESRNLHQGSFLLSLQHPGSAGPPSPFRPVPQYPQHEIVSGARAGEGCEGKRSDSRRRGGFQGWQRARNEVTIKMFCQNFFLLWKTRFSITLLLVESNLLPSDSSPHLTGWAKDLSLLSQLFSHLSADHFLLSTKS